MIIKSFLFNDFYKFSMAQVVLHKYPEAWTKFKFKCRNGTALPFNSIKDNQIFIDEINKELDHLCSLHVTESELSYLSKIPFFKSDYIEYLHLIQLNRNYITVDIEKDHLTITIEGPWISTIWFEVPTLLIVSTLYNKHRPDKLMEFSIEQTGKKRLKKKVKWLNTNLHHDSSFSYADFGTRRAWSPDWHEYVIQYLIKHTKKYLTGTSNVYFAMKYGLKPIGTQAHEIFMANQQLGSRLIDSQKATLQTWADEYRGELGTALTDTVGFDAFINDFDRYFALLFDGCRHDSGDPFKWCEKLIAHYKKLRIDPKTKTAVFSDGLSFPIAVTLYNSFSPYINISFGIGTNLTNDVGVKALQLVIKMVECNHKPVAKISDSNGKGMCEDPGFLLYLKQVFDIP